MDHIVTCCKLVYNDTQCESENQLQDYSNTDAIYVDKRLRRTRGNNRYHCYYPVCSTTDTFLIYDLKREH